MRKVLTRYFSGDCASQAMNISPLGGVDGEGKAFKVRWGLRAPASPAVYG